jgi:Ca2+:H+ antiporter
VMTLVLPNYTTPGIRAGYSPSQLGFIAAVSLGLYAVFVLVQTVSHRDRFQADDAPTDAQLHAAAPSGRVTLISAAMLLACLAVVVLLADLLAVDVTSLVARIGAPHALVGVIIAVVVLLPEGVAAVRAARANRLQTSLNLALGSAMASIGLTIPAVALFALVGGLTLTLGIDMKSTVLLALTLFVTGLSLSTGRTTVLQGAVLLVIFSVYLFTTAVP